MEKACTNTNITLTFEPTWKTRKNLNAPSGDAPISHSTIERDVHIISQKMLQGRGSGHWKQTHLQQHRDALLLPCSTWIFPSNQNNNWMILRLDPKAKNQLQSASGNTRSTQHVKIGQLLTLPKTPQVFPSRQSLFSHLKSTFLHSDHVEFAGEYECQVLEGYSAKDLADGVQSQVYEVTGNRFT